jgi:hypothetical protein
MWYPSKYGADDILGAMNLITPETILAALSIVRKGIVYDLSHDLDQAMPSPGFHGAFFANTQFTLENGAEWHDRHLGKMENGSRLSRRLLQQPEGPAKDPFLLSRTRVVA